MKIYLCAKVNGESARPIQVIKTWLRMNDHEVFAPSEQPYNEGNAEASDSVIYSQDFKGLSEADAVVAVGALGADCAYEIGWAHGAGKPVYWVLSELNTKRHPMLYAVKRLKYISDLKEVLRDVA